MRSPSRWWLWASLAVVAGCLDASSAPDPSSAAASPLPEGACVTAAASAEVVDGEAWARPGGGVSLRVRVRGEAATLARCLEVVGGEDGARLEARVEVSAPEERYTLLLLWGGGAEAEAARLIAALPPDERVAVAWAGASLEVRADFAPAGGSVGRLLVVGSGGPAAPEAALPARLEEAAQALSGLGTPGARVARRVIVVAPALPLAARGGSAVRRAGVSVGWWDGEAPAEEAVLTASVCLDRRRGVVALEAGGRSLGAVALPEAAQAPGAACALGEATPDAASSWLGLELNAAQREVYGARVEALSVEPFGVGLRAEEEVAARPATAHLRGQSSLGCARKSYAAELDAGELAWLPGLWRDEAFLIAMCLDRRYLNQLTGDALMQALGVFPMRHGLREVRLDGVSQGVYLVMDEPASWARTAHLAPQAVIRRRLDSDGKAPEVKWSAGDAGEALARYEALVALGSGDLGGEALVEALEARMDLGSYLRWMALMSLLQVGDYVDEVWFVEARRGDAGWFGVAGWDPDDLFSPCHHGGRFALSDPHGLLYCAEGVLDHGVLGDPAVYGRYVEALRGVMAEVPPARFEALVDGIGERLLVFLARDAVRGAMVELLAEFPEASSASGAREVILAGVEELKAAYRARYEEIGRLVEAWEARP